LGIKATLKLFRPHNLTSVQGVPLLHSDSEAEALKRETADLILSEICSEQTHAIILKASDSSTNTIHVARLGFIHDGC
jgi:hypothetical protein